MSQADQTIQNDTFPTVRADINSNLAALFSANSGNTAPSVTVAFQDWIDTSGASPIWKKRNSANNAWITLGTLSGSTVAFEGTLPSQTGNSGKFLTTNGTVASFAALPASPAGINGIDIFAASGSWTCPAGVTKAHITVAGGGGGGAGASSTSPFSARGYGGTGGLGVGLVTVTPGTTYSITIGSGGAGTNTANGNGASGGSSSFSTLITATGGAGGAGAPGASGTCTDAAADIYQGNTYASLSPVIYGYDTSYSANTAAATWSKNSVFSPGAAGAAEGAASAYTAGGGVSGAVAIWY